jgi:PAS domain S-box-containing protein
MLKHNISAQQILYTVEAAGVGLWECDIESGEVFWSPLVYEIFGRKPGEFKHNLQHLLTFFPAADRECFIEKKAATLRGGAPLNLAHPIVLPDGTVRHVHQIGQLVVSPERTYLSGTVRDISTERAQRSRWKILNSIALKLNDMVVITDDGAADKAGPRIVYVNEAFTARTGYDRAEVVGKSPRMLQGPNTQRGELARIRAAMAASETVRAEMINYTKAGEEFWVEMEISPMPDENGQFSYWVSVERDITQRKLSEQALRRSEAQFRASFEAAAVGETLTDPASSRIIRANDAFARMLGYRPEDLVGRTVWDLTWPEDLIPEQVQYADMLDGGAKAYVREKRYLRRDGGEVWGRASVSVVRTPEVTRPVLTVSIVEDIDESHRSKSALESAKADLEKLLGERTVALAQRDLLLREVYHRVKNNLQIVDSLLMMQAGEVQDPAAKNAFLGVRGRLYALGLVHQQLMTSSNLSTFDVAPFLRELSENIVEGGGGPNIKLNMSATPLDVGLDFAIPLGLIVTELVTNSLKHAFCSGGGTIEIILSQSDDGTILLVVADNGKGYGDIEVASPADTALGTRIVRGMVSQLRGTISVTDQFGTRTEIRLPPPVSP